MIEVIDCEQGTPEWFRARLGLLTASNFAIAMRAKGKGADGTSVQRADLINKLAGEIITGEPMETYGNVHMERGKEWEDEAREAYSFVHDASLTRVGFVRNGQKGASPDSLVGGDGGLEIKTALAHIQIARLRVGKFPPEHQAQVQGNMWVCERAWWDFVSYSRNLPIFTIRVERDQAFIDHMAECVDVFNQELAQTVDYVLNYGRRAAA